MLKRLFLDQPGLKNAVTLFHAPSNPGSTRILTLLKQAQAQSKASATQDQASSHATQDKLQQAEFDLDVVEDPPTPGQMVAILEFMGGPRASPIGKIVVDARNEFDAIRKLEASRDVVKRPLVVDWNQGKVVVGEDEAQVHAMLQSIPNGASETKDAEAK